MKKRHIVFLVLNFAFLYFNVKLFFKAQAFSDRCERTNNGTKAKLVVHQFINHVRHSNSDYPFDVRQEDLEINPDDISLPYEVYHASPEGVWGYSVWEIRTRFENGHEYIATTSRGNDGRWLLESFYLSGPREAVMTRRCLGALVKTARAYMHEHNLASVDYDTLVDANCFSHYRYPFLESARQYADLSTFRFNETDTEVQATTVNGDTVKYMCPPLENQNDDK